MRISIELGQRSYPVFLEYKAAAAFPARVHELCDSRPCAIVTNTTLMKLYKPLLDQWRDALGVKVVHVIDDGERYKTLATWQGILDALLGARLDRSAVVIAFGGGVVGDIAGFAAAAFLRGVDVVQVPTTLLAMVDSSVGGKTGVDHAMGKNLIGAFHQPVMVWIDTAFLNSLPRREYVAGCAEVLKNACIGGPEMFDFIEKNARQILDGDRAVLEQAIERSIWVKAGIVEADERETGGRRALLNFGHTFAHALEVTTGYGRVLHGEAVLWGIACAFDLGKRAGTIDRKHFNRYDALLRMLPRPELPVKPDPAALHAAMFSDKKTRNGALHFVLPSDPGMSVIRNDISREEVLATLTAVFGTGI